MTKALTFLASLDLLQSRRILHQIATGPETPRRIWLMIADIKCNVARNCLHHTPAVLYKPNGISTTKEFVTKLGKNDLFNAPIFCLFV
jgi:hypothetical protein